MAGALPLTHTGAASATPGAGPARAMGRRADLQYVQQQVPRGFSVRFHLARPLGSAPAQRKPRAVRTGGAWCGRGNQTSGSAPPSSESSCPDAGRESCADGKLAAFESAACAAWRHRSAPWLAAAPTV